MQIEGTKLPGLSRWRILTRTISNLPGLLLLVGLFCSPSGLAAVRNVPVDYPRIQNAIDASLNGDLILVSPGVYQENINFKGKAITLSSTNPDDPSVVNTTIIRAPGKGSVVTFTNRETSNSVLMGFTITGGYGTIHAAFGTNIVWGAGIYCELSSPTITRNFITANLSPQGTNVVGYGAGIACIESDALITRNRITANQGYAGGGILTYLGQARIVSNLIYSNSVVVGGGAVLISGGMFLNNTVVKNAAEIAGNVYAISDTNGQSIVSGNILSRAVTGGGLYLEESDTLTRVAYNNVWINAGFDYSGESRTGVDGNISTDPLFVDEAQNDYQLREISPCVNAGDTHFNVIAGELDFYGNPRFHAGRVDIGAHEYFDPFRPRAEAGMDQRILITSLPALITLDGSASTDPNGAAITYHWSQIGGPEGSFADPNAAKPSFTAAKLGTYTFALVVNNGTFDSFADTVAVTLENAAPTANAGDDQVYSDQEPVASITLDGSRSSDPENMALSYRWKQLSGWRVQLSDPNALKPSFMHPWPGIYVFELVVNDGVQDSLPDVIAVVIGPNHAPVADAGFSRYVANSSITLDGTRSYDPDGNGTLTYQWKQVSGPALTISGTNTARPVVGGFVPTSTIRTSVVELVVSDGKLLSAPSRVDIVIVRNYGNNNVLRLVNPPFDTNKPTIVAFGGGNCTTGSGMTFGGIWDLRANWITVDSYAPAYTRYGDMLMVYLSSVAPNYRKPIQTMGFSTGNLPGMEIAWHINTSYRDARYAVNRVALLDAVCSNLGTRVTQFNATRVGGEQCWVDNYISNDPGFSRQPALNGALNVVCNPARAHAYPVQRYFSSSLEYSNAGLTAFAYLSVIGSGKNYQLNTLSNRYYFIINSAQAIAFFNQAQYPGRILAPVSLEGPTNGSTIASGGAVLGCQAVENAVRYQLLFGSDPDRVMDYSVVLDTTNAPNLTITTLPFESTWWTVKAYDQFGSTMYADPRLIQRPQNQPPLADAGPDQMIYAALNGKAQVTLSGAFSSDPDGDALGMMWAWAMGSNLYQSNTPSLTIELPVGVHTFQLMVNDGQLNSQPDVVTITVVAPLECALKIAPSTINLRLEAGHILARIRFPEGITRDQVESDAPLVIYPGGAAALKSRIEVDDAGLVSVFAFFAKETLASELKNGPAELMVAGALRSGQRFYGKDSVKILGKRPGQTGRTSLSGLTP